MKTSEIAVGKTYQHNDAIRTVIWMGEHEGREMVQYTTPDIVLGIHNAPTITLRTFARWAAGEIA